MKVNVTLTTFNLLLLTLFLTETHVTAQVGDDVDQVSATTLQEWEQELSNWGRWGPDDQAGTLNLLTPGNKIEASRLVKQGISLSLSMPMSKEAGVNNGDPLIHSLGTAGQWAGDTYTINYHGYAHSHLDALCHIAGKDKLYNGFPASGRKPEGAEKLGVEQMSSGIFGRGVLVDIPWTRGMNYLEPRTPIFISDLEAWEAKSGVKIKSGDVVLIRTGRWAREKEKGPWQISQNASGLHASTVKWFRERDIAVLGSDAAADVLPSGVEGQSHPVHLLLLYAMGTPILDNLNLEDVAKQAIELNRQTFLFVASPMRIVGGTGSPLNPIAIF